MEISGQIKIIGDSYAGGFSNGLSLTDSGTMEDFSVVSRTQEKTVLRNSNSVELVIDSIAKENVTEIYTTINNNSDSSLTLELITSFMLKGLSVKNIYRLQTCWSAEGKLKVDSITDLHLEKSWNGCAARIEKFGTVGSMPVRTYFPFIAVEDFDGNFIGVQLYLASSWQMELMIRNEDTYTLCGGIADRNFGQWTKTLLPKESFTAPKAVIAEGCSLLDVCDKLVKAQSPAISPFDDSMDILFNEYCTTWGNPSFDNVKRIADKIAGKGIKFLVIDSGWYGKSDSWWESVGEWVVNEDRFPGGMKPIADYIKSKGMIPGLWFEMESVTSKAKGFNDTHLLVSKDGYPLTVANRRFWDMENSDSIEYLTKSVIGTLKDAGFGYLKIDYNDTMGMGCDGNDGPGENLRKKVVASQNFIKKIGKSIPDIVIENCSSGGHRLEPSMMELVSQASFSDAHETLAIPLIAANMHRVIKPSQSQIWAVMRASDTDERLYYSLVSTFLGRMCLSGDIYSLSDHQWGIIEDSISFYKEVAHIIKEGTTTLIDNSTESYNHPVGTQLFLRVLGNEVLLIFHRFEDSEALHSVLMHVGIDLSQYVVLRSFGNADSDFSAVSLHLKQK